MLLIELLVPLWGLHVGHRTVCLFVGSPCWSYNCLSLCGVSMFVIELLVSLRGLHVGHLTACLFVGSPCWSYNCLSLCGASMLGICVFCDVVFFCLSSFCVLRVLLAVLEVR